jgi:predicted CoA-binding protein
MSNLIEKYANEPVWAVVGASNDRSKYGNRIYRTLRRAGYRVYAVNPRETEIEGDKAYKQITELPEVPTVVDMVIPPRFALSTVQQAKEKGVKAIWFQPGAEDPEAIQWAKDNGLDVIESCILVHHVQNPGQAVSGTG